MNPFPTSERAWLLLYIWWLQICGAAAYMLSLVCGAWGGGQAMLTCRAVAYGAIASMWSLICGALYVVLGGSGDAAYMACCCLYVALLLHICGALYVVRGGQAMRNAPPNAKERLLSPQQRCAGAVSYTHLRAHETEADL
eukprot:243647-Rhodomonas_salina.1